MYPRSRGRSLRELAALLLSLGDRSPFFLACVVSHSVIPPGGRLLPKPRHPISHSIGRDNGLEQVIGAFHHNESLRPAGCDKSRLQPGRSVFSLAKLSRSRTRITWHSPLPFPSDAGCDGLLREPAYSVSQFGDFLPEFSKPVL